MPPPLLPSLTLLGPDRQEGAHSRTSSGFLVQEAREIPCLAARCLLESPGSSSQRDLWH